MQPAKLILTTIHDSRKKIKSGWIFVLLKPRLVVGVVLLVLVGDFLLFQKYGADWDEMNRITFWGSTILELYIVLGFSIWITNKVGNVRFYKSFSVLTLLFVVVWWLYDKQEISFPTLRPIHTILDVVLVSLLFTLFALIVNGLRKIKILRTKKTIGVGSAIIAVIIFAIYFNDIRVVASNVYYHTINPEAGALRLERLYKKNYDEAQNALNEANLTISEMTQKSTDTNSLFAYQEKVRGIFSRRDAHFTEMIRIDDEAMKLRLNNRYKEFYQKRKQADVNDYDAFKIYRQGMQNLMDGTLSYFKFTNSYGEAMSFVAILTTPSGFTQENIDHFKSLAANLSLQHNEVDSLAKRGVFTQRLVDSMKTKNASVMLFRDMNDAIVSGDKERADEVMLMFVQQAKIKPPDESDLIAQWAREKRQPVFDAQDEKHRYSLDLYNQAYTYARNERLDNIHSVWGDKIPGTAEEKKLII